MRILIFLFMIFTCTGLYAQVSVKDSSISTVVIAFSYQVQLPAGDMKDRFGVNNAIGLNVFLKHKSAWMFGANGSFMFGDKIREPGLLEAIATTRGEIIGVDGRLADVRLFERGYNVFLHAGRIFPVIGPNPNSGLFVRLGAGFLQHKIRIETIGNTVPNLDDDYKKGYDRLSNGLAFEQLAGYMHFGNKRFINFFAAVTATEAFTQSRRSFDFDLMKKDERKRTDLLFGLKFGWMIPLYKKTADEYFFR